MELAKEHLHKVIDNCRLALKMLECENKRRSVGFIDEVEYHAEAAKWILITDIRGEKDVLNE